MNLIVNQDIHLSDFATTDRERMVELLATKECYPTTLTIPYPYTLDDADKWIAKCTNVTDLCLAIRDNEDRIIGSISIGGNTKPIDQDFKAVLGYWLGKAYWGKGIMTAVVGKVVEYAFNTHFNVKKVSAHCFASNAGSSRVLEKNGFFQEGYHRGNYMKDGELCDGKSFGLLWTDWTRAKLVKSGYLSIQGRGV